MAAIRSTYEDVSPVWLLKEFFIGHQYTWKSRDHHLVKIVHRGAKDIDKAYVLFRLFAQAFDVPICIRKWATLKGEKDQIIVMAHRHETFRGDFLFIDSLLKYPKSSQIHKRIKTLERTDDGCLSPVEKGFLAGLAKAKQVCDEYNKWERDGTRTLPPSLLQVVDAPKTKSTLQKKLDVNQRMQDEIRKHQQSLEAWLAEPHYSEGSVKKAIQECEDCAPKLDAMLKNCVKRQKELAERENFNETSDSSDDETECKRGG